MSSNRQVLVVGKSRLTDAAQLEGVTIEREQDFARALDLLLARRHDVSLIGTLEGGRTSTELVREAVGRDCPVPMIVVGDSHDQSTQRAAVEAGAVWFLDASRADARDLASAVDFAHANRRSFQERNGKFLKEIASYLSHDSKNAVAGIGGAIQVLEQQLPADGVGRVICREIQDRLGQLGGTIEAVTLVLRASDEPVHLKVPLRELLKNASSLRPSPGTAKSPPGLVPTATKPSSPRRD